MIKPTLDELLEAIPIRSKIKYQTGNTASTIQTRVVEGVCYSLPLEVGGDDWPAYVVRDPKENRLGHVFYHEISEKLENRPGSVWEKVEHDN